MSDIFPAIPNFRDLGGHQTTHGTVVTKGLLYRSSQLSSLSSEAETQLKLLDIDVIYDFRTQDERNAYPDFALEKADNIWLDILKDAGDSAAGSIMKVLLVSQKPGLELDNQKIKDLYIDIYTNLVSLPSALNSYRRFFTDLAIMPAKPKLFHCTAGKDRTGWAAALFLTLLGVDQDDVMSDYLKSNELLKTGFKTIIAALVDRGIETSVAEALIGVEPDYLDAAFSQVRQKYGSVANYFSQGLGINEENQSLIIHKFTLE